MLRRRPFATRDALFDAARTEWFALSPHDWREAFRHHPRIGDGAELHARFLHTAHLSQREQEGVSNAPDATLDALAEGNRAYEDKFGFIFIVCATGKTAGGMLALLQARLDNDLDAEIRIAAEEQAKIIAVRLVANGQSDGDETR